MTFVRRIVLLALLLPLVGGCHVFRSASAKACHSPQSYQKAQTVPPLKVPGGLDAPDTTNALRLPHAEGSGASATQRQTALSR